MPFSSVNFRLRSFCEHEDLTQNQKVTAFDNGGDERDIDVANKDFFGRANKDNNGGGY